MCVCVRCSISYGKITIVAIVIRKLCEQLSLNPYSVHGGSKSKEEGGWVGNGQQKEKKKKKDQTSIIAPNPTNEIRQMLSPNVAST